MKILGTVTASALLALASTAASAVIIDTFETDQVAAHSMGAAAPAEGFSIVTGAGIIGGERELLSVKTAGQNFGMVFAAAGSQNGNQLSHSQSSQTSGYSLVLWDGAENLRGNDYGLGANFAGEDGIDFQLTDVDSFGMGLTIKLFVFTSESQYSEIAIPIDAGIGSERVLFSNFSTGSGGLLQNQSNALFLPTAAASSAADFSRVNAIALLIDGTATPDADTSLNLLETFVNPPQPIPLPGTILIFLAGLAGLKLRKFNS